MLKSPPKFAPRKHSSSRPISILRLPCLPLAFLFFRAKPDAGHPAAKVSSIKRGLYFCLARSSVYPANNRRIMQPRDFHWKPFERGGERDGNSIDISRATTHFPPPLSRQFLNPLEQLFLSIRLFAPTVSRAVNTSFPPSFLPSRSTTFRPPIISQIFFPPATRAPLGKSGEKEREEAVLTKGS